MKNYIKIFAVLILLVLSSQSFPQINEDVKLDGFEQYVEKAMKDWNLQGCAVAIVKNGKVIFIKGFGYRDVKNQLPVTENTLFAIGSCTKAFTSAAVCLLVDESKLDLDKPVIDYMPEFKLFDNYVTEHITARDLLCHRSGLPRHDFAWYGADDIPRKDMIERLRYLEPSHGFREVWQYQNGMFAAAGYLVEKVSGVSWENFVKSKILDPLNMKSTNFSIYESQKSTDYSKPYREVKDVVNEIPFRSIDAMGPAGSINSNVTDMSNWVMLQINGGKFNDKQIISDGTLSQTHTPQMVIPGGMSDEVFYSSYGMGWMITSYRGHLRVEHGGNIDGFSASVCLLPRDSAGIVVLTNMDGTSFPSVVRNYAIDRVLGLSEIDWNQKLIADIRKMKEAMKDEKDKKDPNQVEGTSPSHPLESYTGKFENPGYGNVNILMEDNELVGDFHSMKGKLNHYHYDIFETVEDGLIPKLKLTFLTNTKGEIDRFTMPLQDGVKDIEFKRAVDVKKLDEVSLQKFTGEYEIMGTVITISLRNPTTLTAVVPGQPVYELVPIGNNEFNLKNLDGYSLKFTEEDGKITEAVFNQPNGVFKAKKK